MCNRSLIKILSLLWEDFSVLYTKHPSKSSNRIVGICTIVIREDMIISTVTEDCPTELPDRIRGLDPARSLRVKGSDFLEFSILFFCQKLNSERSRHIYSVIFGLIFFSRIESGSVIAETPPSYRALWWAVDEDDLIWFPLEVQDIRLTSRLFHLSEWSEYLWMCLESRLYRRPCSPLMSLHMLLESFPQSTNEFFFFCFWERISWFWSGHRGKNEEIRIWVLYGNGGFFKYRVTKVGDFLIPSLIHKKVCLLVMP